MVVLTLTHILFNRRSHIDNNPRTPPRKSNQNSICPPGPKKNSRAQANEQAGAPPAIELNQHPLAQAEAQAAAEAAAQANHPARRSLENELNQAENNRMGHMTPLRLVPPSPRYVKPSSVGPSPIPITFGLVVATVIALAIRGAFFIHRKITKDD